MKLDPTRSDAISLGQILQDESDAISSLTRHIGYDLMGPVIERWLLGLHQYISYFDDGHTLFLFCARAGVRIKRLYELFLARHGLPQSAKKMEIFWGSRVSVAKGVFRSSPEAASRVIAKEFHDQPLSYLIQSLLRHHNSLLAKIDLANPDLRAHGFNFPGWITTSTAKELRNYLNASSDALQNYVSGITKDYNRVVLIDSGWQGTTQSLLTEAFPTLAWKGLYFGRILTESHDPRITDDVIGILFEGEHFSRAKPETAFVEHRHLIETLLEPNGSSIDEVCGGEFEEIALRLAKSNLEEKPTLVRDPLYMLVEQYLGDSNRENSLALIYSQHECAMKELARILINPTRQEALALNCKDRSADFGKELEVPVLLDKQAENVMTADQRIERALWKQGQVALEYDGKISSEIQLRITGISNVIGYFDPNFLEDLESNDLLKSEVTIITRTKNRPVLLKRAAESVACQTYRNYSWVVVNDGGDDAAVREIIESCAIERRRITLVNNIKSLGMEAASNMGINNSKGEFIVIHDDDDSWHPTFLEKTVKFLNSPSGKRYGGVITGSLYVSEEISGNAVIEHGRVPYHDWVRNVHIAEMACGNFFPPIAFLFRRSIWEEIGGFNEDLPVLGDWYFNMEFLLRADIGVLSDQLAYYHHRDRGDSRNGLYANSVVGGISKHEEFASVARNEFLRKNIERFPAAASVIHGYALNDNRNKRGAQGGGSTTISTVASAYSQRIDRYWLIAEANRAIANMPLWKRLLLRLNPDDTVHLPIGELIRITRQAGHMFDVPPDFNEKHYLIENPDVAAAVSQSVFRTGYHHYISNGQFEGRNRPTNV